MVDQSRESEVEQQGRLCVVQTIAGTSVDHGGTSRSVPALCDALAELGCEVHLVSGVNPGSNSQSILPSRAQVHLCEESKRFGRMWLGRSFAQKLASFDSRCLVHDHGLWLTTNHGVAKTCAHRRLARVVSPRGMAGTWAMNHGKWKKQIAWWLYQRHDLRSATAFHATSDQEALEIRQLGLTQPIAVIPNGIDRPALPTRKRFDGKTRVLFMSRIHPKKGLLNLLHAWHGANLPNSWELVLAGPDEGGFQREVERLVTNLQLTDRVRFLGPVNDVEKWQTYVDADYFVLPSFNENFGIVIAEALQAGLPVITTTGTPWKALEVRECGWWVEPSIMGLQAALGSAAGLSSGERQAMGSRGQHYVTNEFSWHKTASQMVEFYRFIQRGCVEPPQCVVGL